MKLYLAIAGFILLASCNNDNKVITVQDDETGTKTVIDASAAKELSGQFDAKLEELQKQNPYSQEEMKALLPETIAGAARSNMQVTTMMGTSYASADYEINDSTVVSLKMLDCAGEAGAGIYSIQFLAALNTQQEDEQEVTRTTSFNGEKAIEHFEKNGSEATLMWLAKGRLMATLEGNNISIEEIKKLAGSIGL